MPEVDKDGLVRPTGVEELLKFCMSLSMGELLHKVWKAATKAQHQVDVEAVKAERERWWTTIENEIKSEGPHIPAKVLMGVIDQLRMGKP